MRSTQAFLKQALKYVINKLSVLRSHLVYVASRNNAHIWINSDIWISFFHRLFPTGMAYYFSDVTRDWNHDFARCGDVTKARDKKQTVLCPLLISNYSWFSHDVTKIPTKKLSLSLSFYFHVVLQHLFGSKGLFVLRYRTFEFAGFCVTRHQARRRGIRGVRLFAGQWWRTNNTSCKISTFSK